MIGIDDILRVRAAIASAGPYPLWSDTVRMMSRMFTQFGGLLQGQLNDSAAFDVNQIGDPQVEAWLEQLKLKRCSPARPWSVSEQYGF